MKAAIARGELQYQVCSIVRLDSNGDTIRKVYFTEIREGRYRPNRLTGGVKCSSTPNALLRCRLARHVSQLCDELGSAEQLVWGQPLRNNRV